VQRFNLAPLSVTSLFFPFSIPPAFCQDLGIEMIKARPFFSFFRVPVSSLFFPLLVEHEP